MPRVDRAQWLDYPASGKWRIRFYEETNDFVISIEYLPTQTCVLRFDQSQHQTFHSDLFDKKFEDFGIRATFEDKINVAFKALERYCTQGLITCDNDKLEYSSVIEDIKGQILSREVPKGTDRNTRSIFGKANIVNLAK